MYQWQTTCCSSLPKATRLRRLNVVIIEKRSNFVAEKVFVEDSIDYKYLEVTKTSEGRRANS